MDDDAGKRALAAERTIRRALRLLESELRRGSITLTAPHVVRDFLTLRLARMEHEVFCAIWLDAQHRVLEFEELFRGTLTQTSVYPREVVKAALRANAAAVNLVALQRHRGASHGQFRPPFALYRGRTSTPIFRVRNSLGLLLHPSASA